MRAAEPSTTFLLGAARSGTSLLYKALCLHPEAAYFNNHMRRLPRHPAVSVTNRVARRTPVLRRRIWFGEGSNAYVYSQRRALRDRLYPMPVEGEPVFAGCGIPEQVMDTAPTQAQERALRRTVAAVRRWGGGSGFVNKRIANLRRIQLLADTFPRARFVDITRDGRAVALSLSRVDWWDGSTVWWYGGTPEQWLREGGNPWELCARNWVEEVRAIDAGIAALDPARVLRLTYEEFTTNPECTIERVAAFAGLGDDPGWREEIRRMRFRSRNETWRAELSPEALARIETVQAEELRLRGYT